VLEGESGGGRGVCERGVTGERINGSGGERIASGDTVELG